jgi:hypothetical protein
MNVKFTLMHGMEHTKLETHRITLHFDSLVAVNLKRKANLAL